MKDSEETYTENTRQNEEEFLENLKKGKNQEKAEEIYKKNAEKIRKTYQKNLTRELEESKKKKKKKEKKEEEIKPFKVERTSLNPTWKDKLKFKIEITKFRISRKLNNLSQKGIFNQFKYIFYRLRFIIKGSILRLRILKTKIWQKIVKLGNFLKQTFNKTISLIGLALKKLTFWKKGNGDKDKKSDKKESNKENNSEKDNNENSTKENNQ